MRTLLFITVLSLLCATPWANDYMFFSVENFWMSEGHLDSKDNKYIPLHGEIEAKKMLLILGTERIEINPTNGELFQAQVKLDKNIMTFRKDYLTFSTDLGLQNPLKDIQQFKIQNGDVEIKKEAITIDGEALDLKMSGVELSLRYINLVCDTMGTYTTEIDEACLRKSSLQSYKSPFGRTLLTIKDLNSPVPIEFNMQIKLLEIENEHIEGDVENITGTYNTTEYDLNQASLHCYKYKDLKDLDPELIIKGCLKQSHSTFNDFNLKNSNIDGSIQNANITVGESDFSLSSNLTKFKVGEDASVVENLNVHCSKNPIVKSEMISSHLILEGCLNKSKITIDKIEIDQEKMYSLISQYNEDIAQSSKNEYEKGIIDIYDLKKVELISNNNSFTFEAKMKALFRIPVKFKGETEFFANDNTLMIKLEKANIAGIPSKKFVMYLLKKFLNTNDISIKNDTIIVKF